jgi:hypothetical protein
MDILIRDVERGVAASLQAKAAAAGQSQAAYLRGLLEREAAGQPVKARYSIKGYAANGARCAFTRYGDGPGNVDAGAANMTQAQADAYRFAKELVQRNAPGDRERAVALLAVQFEDVFEG